MYLILLNKQKTFQDKQTIFTFILVKDGFKQTGYFAVYLIWAW